MNAHTDIHDLIQAGFLTSDEADLAHSKHAFDTYVPYEPADGPGDEDQELITAADLTVPATLVAQRPKSIHDCLFTFATMRKNHTPIGGVGLCWYDVRNFGWGVAALWPTAQQGGLHGQPIHRFANYNDAPRGMTLIFENDHVWHVTVALGAGLNNTSDLHENGYNGVATIANTYDWCGAHDWYGIEVVNGADCWPNSLKPSPKPEPEPWSWERRIVFLRHEATRQRHDGHLARATQLTRWANRLEAKHHSSK